MSAIEEIEEYDDATRCAQISEDDGNPEMKGGDRLPLRQTCDEKCDARK